jgi:ribosomal protein L34E
MIEKRNIKKKRCEFCGYDINPIALMKHHQRFIVKPSGKEIEWLEKGKTYVLCANCHYILHNMLYGRKAGIEILEEEE